MKNLKKLLSMLAIAGLLTATTLGVTACSDPGPAEEAGQNVDDAFEDMRDGLQDAADEVQEWGQDAVDSIEDGAEEASDAVEDTVDDIRD